MSYRFSLVVLSALVFGPAQGSVLKVSGSNEILELNGDDHSSSPSAQLWNAAQSGDENHELMHDNNGKIVLYKRSDGHNRYLQIASMCEGCVLVWTVDGNAADSWSISGGSVTSSSGWSLCLNGGANDGTPVAITQGGCSYQWYLTEGLAAAQDSVLKVANTNALLELDGDDHSSSPSAQLWNADNSGYENHALTWDNGKIVLNRRTHEGPRYLQIASRSEGSILVWTLDESAADSWTLDENSGQVSSSGWYMCPNGSTNDGTQVVITHGGCHWQWSQGTALATIQSHPVETESSRNSPVALGDSCRPTDPPNNCVGSCDGGKQCFYAHSNCFCINPDMNSNKGIMV